MSKSCPQSSSSLKEPRRSKEGMRSSPQHVQIPCTQNFSTTRPHRRRKTQLFFPCYVKPDFIPVGFRTAVEQPPPNLENRLKIRILASKSKQSRRGLVLCSWRAAISAPRRGVTEEPQHDRGTLRCGESSADAEIRRL